MTVLPASSSALPHSVSLFDRSTFFEKALAYGVRQQLLSHEKLDAIETDAPKGMVQIARYFGSEFLRPELEKAKDRIVNLVSLNLELDSAGDLHRAALMLRDHSFMSRSKAASDMLKALIVMPQNSHFGMNEHGGFSDKHIAQLAKWSLCSLADYRTELAKRQQVAGLIDAALWLADALGLDADDLEDAGPDAEAVIRTALLVLHSKQQGMPDWVKFQSLITALRKPSKSATEQAFKLALPKNLPAEFKSVVEAVRQSLLADGVKIVDNSIPVAKLFKQTPAFVGRYFWIEDSLAEIDHFDREASVAWNKVTQGHTDDGSLLTLFLSIAAGSAHKTLLSEKAAAALVRKVRKSGWHPERATQFILEHAPVQHQSDYVKVWANFVEDALVSLISDRDYKLHDALALLRRDCNVSG
jgi:hypothetical protein